ncbi:hypothetical protein GF362_03520 [Candidatus Dojkabacteria bacterium]|nr:hypothetical protein [Candidatus Dojkabacteria bacterium]
MLDQLLTETISLVEEAGDVVMDIYNNEFSPKEKKDKTPVTEADLKAEKILIKGLKKYDWPILSEETEQEKLSRETEKFWVVDPLDGTQDFIDKTDEFSIMMGLVFNKRPVLGIVYEPAKQKLAYALKENGAYILHGEQKNRLKVSSNKQLRKVRAVMSRSHFSKEDEQLLEKMNTQKILHHGSNGSKIRIIAEAKADLFYNSYKRLGQWDACAPDVIINEAGGKLTDFKGNVIKYTFNSEDKVKGMVATNALLHKKVINILND